MRILYCVKSLFLSALFLLLLNHWVIADSLQPSKENILILGDSISAAYGIDPEEGWVNLLNQKLQKESQAYTAINASISGDTTADGLGRLKPLLKHHQPKIVIVELGGNDGLRGYPLPIMSRNLQAIIDMSQSVDAKVLLAGIEIPPNYGPRYTEAFRNVYTRLAKKNTVAFLPFILDGIATDSALMQRDQIHPTAEAQPIILENVWNYLESLL